jgi:hypothetical protein
MLSFLGCIKKSRESESITGIWKVTQFIQKDEKAISEWLKEPSGILEPVKESENISTRSGAGSEDPAKVLLYNKFISALKEIQKIEITSNEIITYDRNGQIIDSEKYAEIKKIKENEFEVIFNNGQKTIKFKVNGNVCDLETPISYLKLIKE